MAELFNQGKLQEASVFLRKRLPEMPVTAIVLGSGMDLALEGFEIQEDFSYGEVPNLLQSGVAGHGNRMLQVWIGSSPVIVCQGRVHLYEGYSAFEVAFAVGALGEYGVRNIIVANAAGGIRADLTPGIIMPISDHINLQGESPLTGLKHSTRFVDQSSVYDPEVNLALTARFGIPAGVYAGVRGPQYETPAEIRYLMAVGGDAVGMSTVMEVIMAKYYRMRVVGLSLISNYASGIGANSLSHNEVLESGRNSGKKVREMLQYTVSLL